MTNAGGQSHGAPSGKVTVTLAADARATTGLALTYVSAFETM